jgi:serine phosphatase RsbU (regulator of sigma subunit)
MGIAARFSLGLGLFASLFAAIAAALLLQGVDALTTEAVDDALREMTATTAEVRERNAQPPSNWTATSRIAENGKYVSGGDATLRTASGESMEVRVYQAGNTTLVAPRNPSAGATDRILVLVVLVCALLAAMTVLVGALTARRLAHPLRDMVEDVLAISRGRLDRRIRGQNAAGEVAHLAVAMERMVNDLVASLETEEALAASVEDVAGLQELRRNLQPMEFDRPVGWDVETVMLEADDGGSGGFVDAMSDGDGRCTVLVGAASAAGIGGALLMATTRAYLRSSLLGGAEPAVACDFTNSSLNRDLARGLYASAMVARVDPGDGGVHLVSAGHQAAAIRSDTADGQLRKIQPTGIAMGFDRGPIFRNALETVELTLGVGDGLFIFSPELYACASPAGKELGENGAAKLAQIAFEHGLEEVERKLRAFLGGAPEADIGLALLRRLTPVDED